MFSISLLLIYNYKKFDFHYFSFIIFFPMNFDIFILEYKAIENFEFYLILKNRLCNKNNIKLKKISVYWNEEFDGFEKNK